MERRIMISLQGVTKEFHTKNGDITALAGIDLDIEAGEIYGIIGLSGAGKSTLARCFDLLERPTSGKVIIDGRDLMSLSHRELCVERRKIAMIFQQFNLLEQRSAVGNVCFPLEIAGVNKAEAVAKAKELLSVVGLSDREYSYPCQLSGGQKQRVAIARALASDPKILICDEATSALDPETTGSILELIKRINAEYDITVAVITHEMDVVRRICDKALVLDRGRIIKQGSVAEVIGERETVSPVRLFKAPERKEAQN